jgi:hypothetical protein
MSCIEASHLFLSSAKDNLDTYANYTVYLCAQTLSVLFGPRTPHPCTSCESVPEGDGNSYVHRWQELFCQVEQWYENRPSQMKPIFTVTAPDYAGREQPFPIVLYGNGDASKSANYGKKISKLTETVSGNQLYHVSALLLLQQKPKTLSLSRKPVSPSSVNDCRLLNSTRNRFSGMPDRSVPSLPRMPTSKSNLISYILVSH